jgi:PTH1 family peptidyl-tRNA hydrolase
LSALARFDTHDVRHGFLRRELAPMKLIVGLGNPGRKYQQTRHNVGFEVVDLLSRRYDLGRAKKKFKGKLNEAAIGGQNVLLLKPETFMNLSGSSVQLVRDFFQISNDDLLVVCDDFNLPLGQLRFRRGGSAGGQKGLSDILRLAGANDISRLRIGIGNPPAGWDVADYVLSQFRSDETQLISQAISKAVNGVADWVENDIGYCMNRYNSRTEDKE